MSAVRKQKKPVRQLRLEPAPYSSPEIEGDTGADAKIVVSTREGAIEAWLQVDVEYRERHIAQGQPIQAQLYLPNYEGYEPSDAREAMTVHLDALRPIAEAMLAIDAEVRRLGILPPSEKA